MTGNCKVPTFGRRNTSWCRDEPNESFDDVWCQAMPQDLQWTYRKHPYNWCILMLETLIFTTLDCFLIDKGSFLLRHYQYQEIYGLFVAPKWVVLQLKPLEHHGFQPGIWTLDARQTTTNIRTHRCRQVCGLTKKVEHHFAHFVHLGAMEWGDSPVHMHFKAQNAAGGYQPTNLKR